MRRPQERPPTVVMVIDGENEVVVSLDAAVLDLALVDTLARLRLTARRRGWAMQVRDVPDALLELLDLAGLADVVGTDPRSRPRRTPPDGP